MQGDGTGTQVEVAVDEFAARFVGKSGVICPAVGTEAPVQGRRRLVEQRHGHAREYTERRRGPSMRGKGGG